MATSDVLTIAFVAGARPNFPKIAPILAALKGRTDIRSLLVHTGQHYDPELSSMFFEDLGIDSPDWMLGVGSGSHAVQTAAVMVDFERRCLECRPDLIVVVGDVNSTLACALVGAKLPVPVAHVEAGLRSGDRTMPEEINRLVTDAISDVLYTHCQEADENLAREGVPPERIARAGNVMIDTLLRLRDRAQRPADIPGDFIQPCGYGLVTLHRPALVDDPGRFGPMLDALAAISARLPLVYPIHPRARARMRSLGLLPDSDDGQGVSQFRGSHLLLCRPQRYLQFLWLLDHSRLVITDSGGVQEESTVVGVPCLTVRENTERAVTIREGTNRLVGLDPRRLESAVAETLASPMPDHGRIPELWDGEAGRRVADHLVEWLKARRAVAGLR